MPSPVKLVHVTGRPLYARLADELRERIVSGELAPGDRLPSRPQLMRDYGVSDRVVYQAIQILVAEGLAEPRSGSGTYVKGRPVLRRVTRSWHGQALRHGSAWLHDMEAQGLVGTWRAHSRVETASAGIAARLGIAPGDEVMRTRYIYLADGEPAVLETSYEPLALTRETPIMYPESGPYEGRGVTDRMREIGITVTVRVEELAPRAALAEEAGQLGIIPGALVQVIERTHIGRVDGAERPVETADIVLAAERYKVVYRLPAE